MFIQTEALPDPDRLKFIPGETVLPGGSAEFPDEESAERSPLAERLFGVDGVAGISLHTDHVVVEKDPDLDWMVMKPMLLGAIMDHYTSGAPVMHGMEAEAAEDAPADESIVAQIREIIDTRIKPAAKQTGGDVDFVDFKNGDVLVEFQGSAFSLIGGMTNVLRHYVPEVVAVKDYRDALPKPGLDTVEAKSIQTVLDERINPAVANHGGHISLIDVQGDIAYVRLEGGCQGCGMADATLKQGIETEIKEAVPAISQVLDVTDHAGGTNPYYQPGAM